MEQSDYKLDSFIDLKNGSFLFTYNHKKTIIDGVEVHLFDCIETMSNTRDAAIFALIRKRYDVNAEVALINNKIIQQPGSDQEYQQYTDYRVAVKNIVDLSLSNHEEVE